MPYKNGGGNKPELYNPKNGEYCSGSFDVNKEKLLNYYYKIPNRDLIEHINDFNEFEKNEFINYIKTKQTAKILSQNKIDYLFTPLVSGDKSSFLNMLGYNKEELFTDILNNTDFSFMMFDDINKYGLIVKAPTKLISKKDGKNYYVTSIWMFDNDNKTFRFITLHPGGKEIWNLVYSIKLK